MFKYKSREKTVFFVSAIACLFLLSSIAFGGVLDDSFSKDEIRLLVGEIEPISVDGLYRVSLADPGIADIVEATEEEVVLIGTKEGQTPLFLWDDQGKRTLMVFVVNQDLQQVKDRVTDLLKSMDVYSVSVDIHENEGKVVLTGEVLDEKKESFETLVGRYEDSIINLVEIKEIKDLIQIDIQVTELNTTLSKALGVDWSSSLGIGGSAGGRGGVGGGVGGGTGGAGGSLGVGSSRNRGGSSGLQPSYKETLPDFDGSIGDFFQIGDFRRTSLLTAKVSALIEEGMGRILSKPKLVVVSGEEASFLIGGEIPIRTTSATNSTVQQNVQFKEYGISMTVSPTIIDEKIDLTMLMEVSDVDAANSDGRDVAFVTRSADTKLLLDDGQSIVLAGLIKKTDSEIVRRVPFASAVPILGLLFRTRFNPAANQDQELVISLTPHVLNRNRGRTEENLLRESSERGSMDGFSSSSRKKAPYYAGIPGAMKDYVHEIQYKISQSIEYPPLARKRGWEGTVNIGLLVLKDGTLAFALVKKSSGYDVLDDLALKIARNAAPFTSFPTATDLKQLDVTIPIVYSLGN